MYIMLVDLFIYPLLKELKNLSKEKKFLIFFLVTVFIAVGYYRLVLSVFLFTLISCAKKVPFVKERFDGYLKDQRIIEGHWANDLDLVYIRYFYRSCWFISFLIGLYLYYRFGNLSPVDSYCFAFGLRPRWSSEFNFLFHLFFGLIFLGLFVKFLAETHIIWYRNTPVDYKFISNCASCAKVLLVTGVIGGCYIDGRSSSPVLPPSYLGNLYQIYLGRGYGFDTSKAFLKNEALGNFPGYDPKKLMDGSYILTQTSIETFVEQNKPRLRQDLDLPSQYLLGIRKSILPSIFNEK